MSNPLNPQSLSDATLEWIFVVDTLNFSFWPEDPAVPFTVEYKDKSYTNYWSLCAAINRALEEGIAITDPAYYATITMEQLQHVFRSSTATPIPLLNERLAALHEAGTALVEHFDGKFANMLRLASHSADVLMRDVLKHMPMYRDRAAYHGVELCFYKRLQILVADIWACYDGKGDGYFSDIDLITMFADYRVPQALVHLGALEYSPALLERLKRHELMLSGDPDEVEIRGCSIWVVELIRARIAVILREEDPRRPPPNAIQIDFFLWDLAQEFREQMKRVPIHLVRSAFY
ncbi:hypothetical protein CAOG_03086 [Capsaspora owczarzaki ATCC 30864]|uniref:Queuosine 5'-phosphate N-glycosylase/hydrolase n=1 Tax=Capsaspora owczarzaki (strain ATCC 30864) TaxID=595528 RepID=A0A0D2WNQ0_CAPO3|nr:hypothetical protein CAOG_03086 [Capsaspora owczarzaki ATCC 30864]KJE92058.1 hypothetical protein CAOG_003086 [Capsaspora owczarzaki ATCC 30864]|eukprot:XP_004363925.1 hypothetical protein CAOG_03086 [Capsaspora owczarzaki ATCC 30864]